MEWKKVKLKELVGENGIFKDGDWVESKDQDLNGNIRLIQMADIGVRSYKNRSQKFMTNKSFEDLKCTEIKKGDILISRMPEPIGRACIFEGDEKKCATVVDISILRVDSDIADRKWVLYKINSKDISNQIELKATGTTRKRIARSKLGELEIPLPPMDIQIKIANALDKAQELIDNKKTQLEKYDELLQSVFIDMFGDPVTNPKGWEIKKLGEIAKLKAGKNIKAFQLQEKDDSSCFPCFGGNGIRGYLDFYSHEGEYTLIGRQGALCGNVQYGTGKFYVTEHAIVVDTQELVQKWLYFILNLLDLNRLKTGAAQPGLNIEILSNVEILIPPLFLQNKFVSIVEKVEEEKKLCEESLKQMEENFNSIMDKAFKGKLF